METKICKTCNIEHNLDNYNKNRLVCKTCSRNECKVYYNNNKEKSKIRNIEWHSKNKEKHRIRVSKWLLNNPEKAKLIHKYAFEKYLKNSRLLLKDSYIKRILIQNTKLKAKDITPELIELKRKQLTLKRQTNGTKNKQC